MEPIRIKLVGIGGQGIQFMGKLLGQAAYSQGLNVTQASTYEPATSGGLTLMDLNICKKGYDIDYPFVDEEANIMVLLSQRAWNECKSLITSKTYVLIDPDAIDIGKPSFSTERIIAVPFSRVAKETTGTEKVANVVALGYLAERFDLGGHYMYDLLLDANPEDSEEPELLEILPSSFENSLISASPGKFATMNMSAFKKGYELSQDDAASFGVQDGELVGIKPERPLDSHIDPF